MPRWVLILLCSSAFALVAAYALSLTARHPHSLTVPIPPHSSVTMVIPPPMPYRDDPPMRKTPAELQAASPRIAAASVSRTPVRRREPVLRETEDRATEPPGDESPLSGAESIISSVRTDIVPPLPARSEPVIRTAASPVAAVRDQRVYEPVRIQDVPSNNPPLSDTGREPSRRPGVSEAEAAREALRDVRPR